ncbi:adenosylcobinamide kinase /adenosylcobinamide-phosphate guanylyltransferase [Balneicella halophila]|uniref:Adenosylcobinamide kinase n=1 Tax=Balneicella halophila TaxID=1537566 RepID=A0A7L4UNJ5_BALHA|nr:bifunctional adenosylcobinamide kinase/adenosylcobinamide-phosphate guanylyltransferase [Balneicella halophila]PVX50685.1 adenosylcobinamide kinase /adenosylcobinamide-phosphate guanylyltransferase [Balneicella halophila]
MSKIILITGGQRSGKSTYGEQLALELADRPFYIATSRIWDKEHELRIRRHQERRGEEWTTIEEEKFLSKHKFVDKVVLIDCVTLWTTNFFFDLENNVQESLRLLKEEFNTFTDQEATFIFVTNEVGLGGMSTNDIQRKFADLQGWFNQYIASKADEVFMMVCGIPQKIK